MIFYFDKKNFGGIFFDKSIFMEYNIRVEFFFILDNDINKVMYSEVRGLGNSIPAGVDLDKLVNILIWGVKVKEFKVECLRVLVEWKFWGDIKKVVLKVLSELWGVVGSGVNKKRKVC